MGYFSREIAILSRTFTSNASLQEMLNRAASAVPLFRAISIVLAVPSDVHSLKDANRNKMRSDQEVGIVTDGI
jgi:hypothetical protein